MKIAVIAFLMSLSSVAFSADIVADAIKRERASLNDYRDRYRSGKLRTGETAILFGPVALDSAAKNRRLLELDLGVESGMIAFRFLNELKIGNAGLVRPSGDKEKSAIQIITRHPDGSFLGTMPKADGRSIPVLFKGIDFHADGHMLPFSGPLIVTSRHRYADGLHVRQTFVIERLSARVAKAVPQ